MLRGDLSRWYNHPDGWTLKAGVLKPRGKGDIWTKGVFEDFVLDLEFKVQDDSNSGVFLRCASMKNWLHNSMEVQVLDSFGKENVGRHDCGAIYDCLAPTENAARKPGEWNHYTIACDDNKVSIVLNGVQIIDMNLNKWKKPHRNPDGSKNKFNRALKTMVEAGRIGLQDHGKPFVHYRNVRVNRLD